MKSRLFYAKKTDVMSARISDHHPVIHHGVLFWNVMMQGRMRNNRYNNGFGIVETEKQYTSRLIKVAEVIAEIVRRNPSIETIGLCEGPIEPAHVSVFMGALKKFNSMKKFLKNNQLYKPTDERNTNWGLIMLTHSNTQVGAMICDDLDDPRLINRFQLWRLTRDGQDCYFALAHFPFGGDECVMEADRLSVSANRYRDFIANILNQYANKNLVFCADFNFNPYLIKHWNDRVLDNVAHNNSILITTEQNIKSVTVDGVLLSVQEKQKRHLYLLPGTGFFSVFKKEYALLNDHIRSTRRPGMLL